MPARLPLLGIVLAALAGPAPAPAQQVWHAAPDARLAALRGGFALDNGLQVAFGIARSVRIDGTLVSSTSLRIDDLRAMTPQQAAQLAQAGQLAVVQRGAGNEVGVAAGSLLPGLVIQNSDNGRHVQATTVIDVSTNSLELLRRLDFGQMLTDAVRASAAP